MPACVVETEAIQQPTQGGANFHGTTFATNCCRLGTCERHQIILTWLWYQDSNLEYWWEATKIISTPACEYYQMTLTWYQTRIQTWNKHSSIWQVIVLVTLHYLCFLIYNFSNFKIIKTSCISFNKGCTKLIGLKLLTLQPGMRYVVIARDDVWLARHRKATSQPNYSVSINFEKSHRTLNSWIAFTRKLGLEGSTKKMDVFDVDFRCNASYSCFGLRHSAFGFRLSTSYIGLRLSSQIS